MMELIMLSCKKATLLIEKKLLTPLSFKEKVQLKMHKSLCTACTNYEQQSVLIDELLRNHIQDDENLIHDDNLTSNEALKQKIMEKLK